MKKLSKWIWILEIEVQGKNEGDALERVKDRLRAFILRGISLSEGKIRKVEN